MINKIIAELVDGKKTYSVSGFALFSNLMECVPTTLPEWTELFNFGAALLAFILVGWRLLFKIRNRGKK